MDPHDIHQTWTAIAHAGQHQEIFSATIQFSGNRKDAVSQRLASFAKFPSIDGGEESCIKVTGRQGRELAEKANTFHDGWICEDIVNILQLSEKVSIAYGDTVLFFRGYKINQ